MAKEDKVINIIKQKVEGAENGTLFFNNSFSEFDDEYVGQILSDLTEQGVIHRLSRGVYLKAEKTRFGLVYPSVEEIAAAIAKRDNAQVIPTGATAHNLLGLSDQVPMNAVFLTSGSARKIVLCGRTITFRRAVPRNFAIRGRYTSLIVQALKYIGEGNMTEEDYAHVKDIIKAHLELETIEGDLAAMPTWIRRVFLKTINETKV